MRWSRHKEGLCTGLGRHLNKGHRQRSSRPQRFQQQLQLRCIVITQIRISRERRIAITAQDGSESGYQRFGPQRIIFFRPVIEVLFRFGRSALLKGLKDDGEKLCLIGLALTACATVGQIAGDGLPARRFRRQWVRGGLFQVVQDGPGRPGSSGVTEWLFALNRAVQFATGFVVTFQFDRLRSRLLPTVSRRPMPSGLLRILFSDRLRETPTGCDGRV